jgi:hypothetical protein
MASLKDPEHPEIYEPKNLGTGRVFKRPRGDFRTKRRDKEREWSQKLQFEKPVHVGSHTLKTFSFR